MPLTDQERADLEAMSSGQVSDAMEALNMRRSVISGFTMLAPHGSKIVGPAVTLRQMPKNAGDARETRLTRHQELSRKIAQKGDVVVVIFHDHGSRYLGKMFNDDWMREKGFLEKSGMTARDLVALGLSGELRSLDGNEPVEHALTMMS